MSTEILPTNMVEEAKETVLTITTLHTSIVEETKEKNEDPSCLEVKENTFTYDLPCLAYSMVMTCLEPVLEDVYNVLTSDSKYVATLRNTLETTAPAELVKIMREQNGSFSEEEVLHYGPMFVEIANKGYFDPFIYVYSKMKRSAFTFTITTV